MNELKRQILKEFWTMQCDEDDGHFFEDETSLISYKNLEKELGIERARLKPELHELRNDGYIELGMAVNYDYIPHGSGWLLTGKGVIKCNDLFLNV